MQENKLGYMEGRFAELIWERAPIRTGELAKLCLEQFDWKRTTTYTMLKRLCQRGLFTNENGTVQALLTKEEFDGRQSEQFVEEAFGGSLPAFIAAFTKSRSLTDQEAEEIQRLIHESRERRISRNNGTVTVPETEKPE